MNTDGRITMNADGKGTKWKRNNCTYGEDRSDEHEKYVNDDDNDDDYNDDEEDDLIELW